MEIFKATYNVDKNKYYLRVLGEEFAFNNQLKYIIIYNNKISYFKDSIPIKKIEGDKLKIKIKFLENIDDKRGMFEGCTSLLTFSQEKNAENLIKNPRIIKQNNKSILIKSIEKNNSKSRDNINKEINKYSEDNDSHDIYNNIEPSKISEKEEELSNASFTFWIKYLIPKKYKNISFYRMFFYCSSLISISGISEWNTNNVGDISEMFYNCTSLKSLPDISKWNTSKVYNMSYMFYNCSSLMSLPDISKWKTYCIKNMKGMLSFCTSLKEIPDISHWKTYNVIDMSEMFSCCTSLKEIPDISDWETYNVENMSGMFFNCSSLEKLPDLFKWKTDNVKNMSIIFANCLS